MQIFPFEPVYDENSRVLVLGTFPSVKSRETGFYYGHPRNRFWRVLAALVNSPVPSGNDEKKAFLLAHGIALWDVIYSCEIENSSDSSIRNAVANDIPALLAKTQIKAVFANGAKADELYRALSEKETGIKAIRLPSTSPANAAFSAEKLTAAWSALKEYL